VACPESDELVSSTPDARDMNVYLAWTLTVLYYISVPFTALVYSILYLLRPVWYLIYVVLLPFAYVGHYLSAIVTYPLRFLGTLEVRPSSFIRHAVVSISFSCLHSQLLSVFMSYSLIFDRVRLSFPLSDP
jgi:hypothetical protein